MKGKLSSNTVKVLSLAGCQQSLSVRERNAHKGNFGHILIIGGDYGKGGAACLAGLAALRSGAGMVSIATRPEYSFAIAGSHPELMCQGIEETKDLEPLLERATVIAIGPGLGMNPWGESLLTRVLQSSLPLVVDADALNQLAKKPKSRDNWILTPHPGEAARMLGQTVGDVQKDRLSAIQRLQDRFKGTVVLKGADTLILGSSGVCHVCHLGNPGMAIAGMGDLLTGVIAALVAQQLSLIDSACLGVLAHATAGDQVSKQGERGILASDLLQGVRECLNP